MPSIIIEPARASDYLQVAALDRLAWPVVPDVFIPDGEHIRGFYRPHEDRYLMAHPGQSPS
jgi:hypothetical protein